MRMGSVTSSPVDTETSSISSSPSVLRSSAMPGGELVGVPPSAAAVRAGRRGEDPLRDGAGRNGRCRGRFLQPGGKDWTRLGRQFDGGGGAASRRPLRREARAFQGGTGEAS